MSVVAHPLELLLRKLETSSHLAEEDRDAIRSLPMFVQTLDAQSYCLRDGEPPTRCSVVVSGFAYRHKLTVDGARQIVSIHIPGEPLDFQNLFLDVSDHNIQTLTRAEIAFIPRQALQELVLSRPGIAQAVSIASLIEGSIFREWVLNVGRRNARARIAHLLCEFAIRLDAQGLAQDYGYVLPMTQEQLADSVGLTSVHVNRTLKALEAEGLIVRSGRQVSFPDWRRLREVAGFNARYLHLDRQQSYVAA